MDLKNFKKIKTLWRKVLQSLQPFWRLSVTNTQFVDYKHTNRKTWKQSIYIYIYILPKDVSVRTDGRRIRIGVSRTVKNVKS